MFIWVRSQNCGCLVTWFCYQLIAKPGNKTATVLWPDPFADLEFCHPCLYLYVSWHLMVLSHQQSQCWLQRYDYQKLCVGFHWMDHILQDGLQDLMKSYGHDDVIGWKHFLCYWPFVPFVIGEFPSQRPVMWSFDVFFDLHLNKRLSKQSRCQWFEMQSYSL